MQGRLNEQAKREAEWQGFEQFHDTSAPPPSEFVEIRNSNTSSNKEENLYDVSPHKKAHKIRTSQRKKSDVRIEMPNDTSPSPEKALKLSSTSALKSTQEKAGPKSEPRRFERVPIIRYEEDCRYSGKVVYKNFIPRTSDNYMRILKEVDWEQSVDKKRDIRNLHGIEFNSQFQSGNLNLAIELQYDLYMRVDSNTNGHRQWFYFSMKNEKKCRVKLHIYRFKKLYSLFQRGMRPYVKSRKSCKSWKPGGDNVQYRYQRQRNEYGVKKDVKSFVLSLSFTFEHENDEVFMAAGIPYSYTFLQKQLLTYKQQVDKKENLSFQVTIIGRSMCGLDIPLITVQHKMCKLVHADKKKRFIIINARTHSGETSSSWTLDGFLQQLGQSDAVDSWMLSENICLKITPMLNPDGVFIGNYRTGIVGDDFNRKFQSGKKEFYPQIFALKRLVRQCKSEGTVQLFFDLHGHSILKNSFIYGPSQDYSSKFTMSNLPIFLLHNSKYFRFSSCKFKTQKENAETARIYFQIKEDILTFTCENSLGLYQNQYQTFQMLAGDWQAFGQAIVHSMIESFRNRDIHIPQTSPGKQKQKSPHKQHKQSASVKSNFASKLQQKIGVDEPKLKMQTTKNSKKQRAYFKIPSVHKNMSSSQHIADINYSFSQQIQREDQFLQPKQFSFNEKIMRQESRDGKQPINVRRKSEVMKVPASNILQRIIGKNKLQSLERKTTEQENAWMCLGRSSTYDTSEALQRQIHLIQKNQEELENQQDEMEPIDENFSDDYVSMNDLDSDGENLPEQEKNYLFQYIKSNQHRVLSNEEEEDVRRTSEKEEPISRTKEIGDAKISRFREIRFKSIEEIYEADPSKEVVRTNTKKPKLEPHKFKDNVSKSLIYKYNDMLSHSEFDDPTMIAFSQQKQLNERNHRRTQKDPFILFQRKDKLDKQ